MSLGFPPAAESSFYTRALQLVSSSGLSSATLAMSSLIEIWGAELEKLRKKRQDGVFSSWGRGSVKKEGETSLLGFPRLSQAVKSKLLQQSEECIDSETTLSILVDCFGL